MKDRRISAQLRSPVDTQELISNRIRYAKELVRVRAELADKFPLITNENAAEVIACQSAMIAAIQLTTPRNV